MSNPSRHGGTASTGSAPTITADDDQDDVEQVSYPHHPIVTDEDAAERPPHPLHPASSQHRRTPSQQARRQRMLESLGEEQPGGGGPRSPRHYPPPASTRAAYASRAPPPQPRTAAPRAPRSYSGSMRSMHKYTFFRERTPSPPGYTGTSREKRYNAMAYAAPGLTSQDTTIMAGSSLEDGEGRRIAAEDEQKRNSRDSRIWKLPRWLCLLITLGAVLVVIGVAVGVGVGVGLGQRLTQSSSALPSLTTTSTAGASPPTITPIPSPTTSNGPSPAAPSVFPTDCPGVNNTYYFVPGSSKTFLRMCEIDFGGADPDGATDLTHVPTSSFSECMNNCAGTWGCAGCSWGPMANDSGGEHQCWMKSELRRSHMVPNWRFAILQQ